MQTPRDAAGVRALLQAAFPGGAEADLVARLQADGDAAFALVAETEAEGGIAGHVMFSRMKAPVECLGLGPVAVRPDLQGRGIGTALIHAGIRQARAEGWKGIFVLGEPAYYRRFGFSAEKARGYTSPYQGPNLMALQLGDEPIPFGVGMLAYAPAFAGM